MTIVKVEKGEVEKGDRSRKVTDLLFGFFRNRQCSVVLLVILTGCANPALTEHAQSAKDQWNEEILLQLSELRKAQGELSKQVSELSAEVQALRSSDQRGQRAAFDLRNSVYPVLGDAKAEVAIVEFSDFECPYCRLYQKNTLPKLTDKYVNGGQVKYVFVDFPLSFHAQAQPAAVAAACAHQQGAFWKMHGLLFDNQKALGEQTFQKLATDLQLKSEEFNQCLRDPKIVAQIREQVRLAEAAGVQGTPAFLIGRIRNGVLTGAKLMTGAQPLLNFERVVGQFLENTKDGK